MRDDFPQPVKEQLAKRVGFRCSNPQCRQQTSGPQSEETGAINIGVAAHITAAARLGPRYDNALGSDGRKSASNGIWLCETCAKIVDSDVTAYPEALLRDWKEPLRLPPFWSSKGSRSSPTIVRCFESLRANSPISSRKCAAMSGKILSSVSSF